jgi:lipopolysaccharide transport system ATP-binding protein
MEEVTKRAGRTILFVSHNMSAILNLCQRCILLEKGKVKMIGKTRDVVNHYLNLDGSSQEKAKEATTEFKADEKKIIQTTKIVVLNKKNKPSPDIPMNEDFSVDIEYVVNQKLENVMTSVIFFAPGSQRVLDTYSDDAGKQEMGPKTPGHYKTRISVPNMFNTNAYNIMVVLWRGNETLDVAESSQFRIVETEGRSYNVQDRASIIPKLSWHTEKIKDGQN